MLIFFYLYSCNFYYFFFAVTPFGMILNLQQNIPKYIKITKLDYQLMREIAHHFDSNGIKYGINLSSASSLAHLEMQNCIKDKYNMFTEFVNNKHYNVSVRFF